MKYSSILAASALLLSGCRERTVPEEHAQPQGEASIVSAVHARKADAAMLRRLATAQWTRRACNLDGVDNGPLSAVLPKAHAHVLKGFMLSPDNQAVSDFIVVFRADDIFMFPAITDKARPDVVAYFKDPDLMQTGFELDISLDELPQGEYEVSFFLDRAAGMFFCESGKRLRVAD